MRLIVVLLFINLFWISHAQVVNPKIWYIGYQTEFKKDTSTPDTDFYITQHGSTILNFKNNPITLTRFGYSLSLGACNVQLFDKNDSLILYSNGSKIFNGKHRLIEGGDSLSYGSDWATSPFAPNENDLKIAYLDSYVTDLLDKNNKVAIAVAAISNTRIDRDKVLYKKETGLYDIAMAVKLYVRSIFGTTSPEYAQVKSLSFTNRKS